jgi:hypothetical protein
MSEENQTVEDQIQDTNPDENGLEDCSFCISVVDGITSLKAEGTLGGIAEVFANAALQSEQLNELLKIVMFMLAEHEAASKMESGETGDAEELLKAMFGQMGDIGHA